MTWGRIVSLFAYGARLAQHCVENDMSNMVIDVVSSLSHVAVDKLTPFLKDHGGWVRICFYFLSIKIVLVFTQIILTLNTVFKMI